MRFLDSLLLLIVLAAPLEAQAERGRFYGVGAGATFAQDPAKDMGVALSASVAIPVGGEGERSLLWARGKLMGMITGDSWAVVPSLMGAVSGRFGFLELSLEGGFHIFGVARYAEQTSFSIFGVGGGTAVMIWPAETWRIGVRADLSWLPSSLSSPIDKPTEDAANSFLFVSALLSVEFLADFD